MSASQLEGGRWGGKVVVVTGSSSGIGEETARRFDAEGASVVINSSRSIKEGEVVARSLSDALYVQADIATDGDPARLVAAAIDRWGRIDVLVNNAGTTEIIDHADLDRATVDVWRRIFEVNVFGTWAMTVAAVPSLRESAGAVVNVTSIAGIRPTGSSIPYATSKAALAHQTILLAKTLGPSIRVNGVAPGLVDTPWTADWDVVRGFVESVAPLRRSGKPRDIADVVVAVAGAAYMTGQIIAVDGGFTLAV